MNARQSASPHHPHTSPSVNPLLVIALLAVLSPVAAPHEAAARPQEQTPPEPAPVPVPAEEAAQGMIRGIVLTQHTRKPIVGAEVSIVGRGRLVRTDAAGRFTLGPLPPAVYLLSIQATGYAAAARQVEVAGAPVEVEIVVDLLYHEKKITVTAQPYSTDLLQVFQPTGSLGEKELEQRAAVSLGTTLQNEPGVSSTNLGTATARPVIRGLGGDRVLIIEDGLRIGDVSSISPDHGVAADPAAAERIEIVRGPANLLYGSGAIGGVINVINNEIPTRLIDRPTGSLLLAGGSNASEFSSTGEFEASAGPVAFRAGASHRDAGEFEFNGGVAGNSDFDVDGGNLGVSLVGPLGSFGASFRTYEANYGIPISEAGAPLGEGEEGVSIDMEQDSFRLLGEISRGFGPFKGLRVQAVRRDYKHAEIEDGAVGTQFDLETTEVRAEMAQKSAGRLKGSFGVWYLDQDFEAVGDEALVRAAATRGYAGFIYEELAFDRVSWLFGGRYDSHQVDSLDPLAPAERDFSDLSMAAGAIVKLGGILDLTVNLSHSFKAPSAEELYANGPHVATFTFEQGNPDLGEESGNTLDLGLRFKGRRFDGELNLFKTRFDDFIFLQPTGVFDDPPPGGSGLPISQYAQADADFTGAEWHADIHLLEHLTLELLADYVRAENLDTDEPLPQISPMRAGVGLTWATDRYFVTGEVRAASKQDRIAPVETETGGYTLYNLFGGVTIPGRGLVHRFGVRLENLTDKLYRNHVSLTKDIVPQPGFNAQMTYRLIF
jgi:iron complex outermembrane receptor protein